MGRAGYLPASTAPFTVGGDPSKPDFRVRDLDTYPGVDEGRLERRRDFREALDNFSRLTEQSAPKGDPHFEQAYRLISSPQARRAFDLASEPRQVRDRYGRRTLGQSCLLARRLVEAGVPFVTVTDRGWDTHQALFNRLKEGYTGGSVGKVPTLDLALAALVEDLGERGLLDSTLIVVMGEFGRTPKLNASGGRDHWPRAFSVVLAGGGVRGGQVIGASDSRGESPADRPVTPADLACTIYTLLGIDPRREFHTSDGRPVAVNQGGTLIKELLA
jgi:arylsulfatase A-like enzyme